MLRGLKTDGKNLARKAGVWSLRQYLGFALKTTRWTFLVNERAWPLLTSQNGQTAVVAFWHEVLPLTPALWWWAEPQNPHIRLHVLISRNRDGRMIADVVAPWRIWSIAGSSDSKGKNKGGAAALRRMRASLRHGSLVAITPDGPRGPRRQAQQGALALAELAGKPIVPVGATCFGLHLKSWDRMIFPLPFGRGVFACAAPIEMRRQKAAEHTDQQATPAQQLEHALDTMMHLAQTPVNAPLPSGYMREKIVLRPLSLMPSRVWQVAATVLSPALPFFLRWRQTKGKEIPARVREKMGFPSQPRGSGNLLWFHAASVGETVSILPLVLACLAQKSDVRVLVTTGTVTAARVLVQRLAHPRVIHQFMPLDVPRWGKRFLDYWQPKAAVFTESELWPNMLGLCHTRNLPVMLVNGRMSASSFKGWQRMGPVARRMLERFAWVSARSDEDAQRLQQLGATKQLETGDLKTAAPPLPVDEAELARLKERLAGRRIFAAVSTHQGEEQQIAQAAKLIRRDNPDVLVLVIPRHPERGADLSVMLGYVPRRGAGQIPTEDDLFWVCDTLGELGLFFRLAPCVFIGNSLPGVLGGGGGHNPFEPARLGCAIASGPLVQNFTDAFRHMAAGVTIVHNAQELAAWVRDMFANPSRRQQLAQSVQQVATANADLPERLAKHILAQIW
ncbi:glycosyltransferase N-terminal domain-containing protein [Acetobacter pomorum]|nr:glycosyltransferase N-terminal domain-containing protein [Acetobacter pomorum]